MSYIGVTKVFRGDLDRFRHVTGNEIQSVQNVIARIQRNKMADLSTRKPIFGGEEAESDSFRCSQNSVTNRTTVTAIGKVK